MYPLQSWMMYTTLASIISKEKLPTGYVRSLMWCSQEVSGKVLRT